MKSLEEQLKDYSRMTVEPDETKIKHTLEQSKKVFYESLENQTSPYFAFIYQQAGYIKKRWWVLQLFLLLLLWWIIYGERDEAFIQRCMGVLAPAFIILVIPELWKNRSFGAMEVEGAAYYSLRQIYAARMLIFTAVDGTLLGAFTGVMFLTTSIKMEEMLLQFFLPMIVTCCICLRTLYSKYITSEYFAVSLSLLWITVWIFVVLQDSVFREVSVPIWIGIYCVAILYFIYAVRRAVRESENYWEVAVQWN